MTDAQYVIETTAAHVHIAFARPHRVLSSAVLNGGLVDAECIANVKVDENFMGGKGPFDPPEVTLSEYCSAMGWCGLAVGMMTSASMDSFRVARRMEQGVEVTAVLTAGLSNARRAGDPAESRALGLPSSNAGTINIILLTNARMTDAAMAEAIITATEAKTAVLAELNVRSRSTGRQATGTGTDAIAIASGSGPIEIRYCGKHVIFGEMTASAVTEALASSLRWPQD